MLRPPTRALPSVIVDTEKVLREADGSVELVVVRPHADGKVIAPGCVSKPSRSWREARRSQAPIQGESHVDFLGESEGSPPSPPHDSFPDAGEAINDFGSMSGNFIYRHHVEPRVKLYSPRKESFPIPLKYIDFSRTTDTNLDVKQE